MTKDICCVKECNNKTYAKGLCRKHYDKLRNYGDPLHKTRKDKNNIILYDDYAEIELSNTGNYAVIDLDDVDRVRYHKWYEKDDGYVSSVINGKSINLHTFLLGKNFEYEMIDHKDRNRLNNKKSNLRYASRIENSRNKGIQTNNTSGVVGVSWHKQHQKWYARITVNKKPIFLGLFDSIDEAKKCRIDAEHKYFGEYRSEVNDNCITKTS